MGGGRCFARFHDAIRPVRLFFAGKPGKWPAFVSSARSPRAWGFLAGRSTTNPLDEFLCTTWRFPSECTRTGPAAWDYDRALCPPDRLYDRGSGIHDIGVTQRRFRRVRHTRFFLSGDARTKPSVFRPVLEPKFILALGARGSLSSQRFWAMRDGAPAYC